MYISEVSSKVRYNCLKYSTNKITAKVTLPNFLETNVMGSRSFMCHKMCRALTHCLAYHNGETCVLLLSGPFDIVKQYEDRAIIKLIEEKYRL